MANWYKWTSRSPEATRALAAALGKWLAPGDVLALKGELGSGKTEFVHGLAQGLEVPEAAVASPSFTLVHEYPGRLPLVHIDLYRLENLPLEMLPDLEEYLSGPRVVAVEWAERLGALLPKEYLEVEIETTGESTREFTFRGHGPRGEELARLLAHWLEEE
ncbi:MAG: tRNA (adenosine(37)-N6)-threonylcarbamoyltransferase complex ATPase subunit type 1 TsaE [Deltaproteobacteria bacterium]|nr:tRNA (adenosine(37)-N6)-threonylcarbamoyltransferase complex ATPase subunit type 1 TsaE [Deltaproteobacteria bacterium]